MVPALFVCLVLGIEQSEIETRSARDAAIGIAPVHATQPHREFVAREAALDSKAVGGSGLDEASRGTTPREGDSPTTSVDEVPAANETAAAGGGAYLSPTFWLCGGYGFLPTGDCNGDAVRDVDDVRAMSDCMAGPDHLIECDCVCADWNGDGSVALDDYSAALSVRAGLPPFALGGISVVQQPSFGFCPAYGRVFYAQVFPTQDGRHMLVGSRLVVADGQGLVCHVQSSYPPYCGRIESFEPRLLEDEDMQTLNALRAAVPAEGCQPGEEDCVVDWCRIEYVNPMGSSACGCGGGHSIEYGRRIDDILNFVDGLASP